MITVDPTTDENYIKSVFLNPSIYASMKDDSCPSDPAVLWKWNAVSSGSIFLKVLIDSIPAGVFWLVWKGKALEAHTALLENCRGRTAIDATKKALEWVFKNTKAKAVTSYAWSDSPVVSWFCRAVGMTKTHSKPWPSKRDGKPVKIHYFKILKEEF